MEICAWPCGNTGDEAQNCMEIRREETFPQNTDGRVGRHLVDQWDKGVTTSKNYICTGAETGHVWGINYKWFSVK